MKRFIYSCVAVAGAVMTPLTAWCSDRYSIPQRDETMPWPAILYTLVATAAVCAVAFKNAKRSHLD